MAAASAALSAPLGTDGNRETLPRWMDPKRTHGQLIVLAMVPTEGNFPDNPFVIGKSIEQAAGKIQEAVTESRGTKYVLRVRNQEQVEKLLALTKLIDGTKVEVTLHPTLNFVQCKVSCREAINASVEELLEGLKPQGVTGVRRITRYENGVKVNTPTLVLTISGTVIPRRIAFGPLMVRTETYYPSPMTCFNCFDIGHTKKNCKIAGRCQNCSKNHSQDVGQTCPDPAYCFHCKENHRPMSKGCKRYETEVKIISIKVNNNMTFPEAKKEYERIHGSSSYAAVSSVQTRLKEDEKQREIDMLRKELDRMKGLRLNAAQNQLKEDEKQREIDSLRKELHRMKGLEQEVHTLRKVIEDLQMKKKNKRSRKNKKKGDDVQSSDAEEEMECQQLKRKNDKANSGTISPPLKKLVSGPVGHTVSEVGTQDEFDQTYSDDPMTDDDLKAVKQKRERGASGGAVNRHPSHRSQ